MKSVRLFVVCFAVRVHLFQMSVMVASLNLYGRDAEDALTMDFWIVLFATMSLAVMSAWNFLAKNLKISVQNLLLTGFVITQM